MEKEYKYMVCTRCSTFNHAPFIVDTMNGFTMQETTFPVVSLIIDDASTDGEPEIIKQYLKDYFLNPYREEETDDYCMICAKHKSNLNCTFIVFLLKYNHYSIKKSKLPYLSEWLDNSKYHALCEGDDYWIHPNKLQIQVFFLESHPNISYTCTRYKTYIEKVYGMGDDIFLFSSIDEDITSFRMINVSFTKNTDEPIGEILVDPNTASIRFVSHYLGKSNTLINVKYDNIEKNWDVRSYIDGNEKLTHLKDALVDIENNETDGLEIKNNFLQIINASKEAFNKSMENKLNK